MIDVRTTTEKATTKDTDSTICDVNEMTLKKGGFECKGNCINNNVGYHNWSIAWEKSRIINIGIILFTQIIFVVASIFPSEYF